MRDAMPRLAPRFNRGLAGAASASLAIFSLRAHALSFGDTIEGSGMRRSLLLSLASLLLAANAAVAQAPAQPPHAWLFGTWTGGIFPPPPNASPQACFSQPVVIFTRDLVMRATLTEQTLSQREIETVRSSPSGAEFRFAVTGVAPVFGGAGPRTGFGCDSPDVLHVQRRGENEIAFPGCADFPYPLVRCHTR
jgi:hypothetical protein